MNNLLRFVDLVEDNLRISKRLRTVEVEIDQILNTPADSLEELIIRVNRRADLKSEKSVLQLQEIDTLIELAELNLEDKEAHTLLELSQAKQLHEGKLFLTTKYKEKLQELSNTGLVTEQAKPFLLRKIVNLESKERDEIIRISNLTEEIQEIVNA